MSNETKNFYRERDLLNGILPFSSSTLWRLVRVGDFPAPAKFGGVTAWKAADVNDWLESKLPPKALKDRCGK